MACLFGLLAESPDLHRSVIVDYNLYFQGSAHVVPSERIAHSGKRMALLGFALRFALSALLFAAHKRAARIQGGAYLPQIEPFFI